MSESLRQTNQTTNYAKVEHRSTEKSDHYEQNVLVPKHIDDLPVELLFDIFDYLSLKDLCLVRQTSQKWRQLAGSCFQINYSPPVVRYRIGEKLYAFTQVIRRISIKDMKRFQHFIDKKPNYEQVKSINLTSIDLTSGRIDFMREVLNNVEHLDMVWCKVDEQSVDHILALTTNLKHLNLYSRKNE